MDYLLLPDFLAMCLLMPVLRLVRGQYQRDAIRLWTGALLMILLECAARIVYEMPRLPLPVHRTMHVLALDAYLMAGALFLRSASEPLRRMRRSAVFLWVNIAPHLLLLSVYGADVRDPRAYYGICIAGAVTSVITCVLLKKAALYYVAFMCMWSALTFCIFAHELRATAYVTLFFLYALVAAVFFRGLPVGSRGKIAVVTGFALWSLCFLTHPVIARQYPQWLEFASELWNMQKFIITIGLLLVLVEKKARDSEWLALHDQLTSLPNRRLFEDRLQIAVARAGRERQRIAIFNIDLDGFKSVNDTLGHDAGDQLLREVARNLIAAHRKSDTLARVGGDEFSLIAVDMGDQPGEMTTGVHPLEYPQTERILNLLVQAVETPINLELVDGTVKPARISASIGCAIFPDDGDDVTNLLRLADQRMYMKKRDRAMRRKSSGGHVITFPEGAPTGAARSADGSRATPIARARVTQITNAQN